MSKELVLFEKNKISFKIRFFLLMNLLVQNQSINYLESIFFIGFYYVQILSGFYSRYIGVFSPDDSISDMILNYIQKIFRYRGLLTGNPFAYEVSIYTISIIVLIFLIFFLIVLSSTNKRSFYSCQEAILNFGLKIFIYILFNIILDLFIGIICFEDTNPRFSTMTCSIKDNIVIFVIGLLLVIVSVFFHIFIQFYYTDSLFISTSYYAKISCNYELLISLNSIVFAVFLNLVRNVTKEIFFIYNLIVSLLLLRFYLKKLIFYDKISNHLCGLFHLLYFWSSIFFFIFAYVDIKEKGLVFIISSIIVCFIYFNMRNRLDEAIFMTNPYYKIMNKDYLLYYIRCIIDKINRSDETPEDKAMLTGIIQLHIIECPNPNCITKNNNKLYLPRADKWSDRSKPCFLDKVFLRNFIIAIVRYFISLNFFSPEMIINISLYYLTVIGNYCQCLYFYQKVKEMTLTTQEKFAFQRLKEAITDTLSSKLKPCNEPCYNLEDLNVTYFFEYEELAKQFHEEINHDIQLSLEFWKTFSKGENRRVLDFNKVFKITDQIRIAKANVEKIWGKIFRLYSGVNDLFIFYLDYIEQINDDNQLKRELEAIKRKNEISTDNIQQNYYNILFSNETGISIVNGDRGKEGLIEKVNPEFEKLFKYNPDELRGMNISSLMPKIFQKEHKGFMQKYFDIGEKKIIDKKGYKTFAKDKDNSILLVKLAIKLFPIVNESVYFIGMIMPEKIDDIIFIDNTFNIQGMSQKLMDRLAFENKNFFTDYDIPFYLICKKFIYFYKTFLQGKKKTSNIVNIEKKKTVHLALGDSNFEIQSEVDLDSHRKSNIDSNKDALGNNSNYKEGGGNNNDNKNDEDEDIHDNNIEINENIELEYEIKVPGFLIDYANQSEKRDNKYFDNTQISAVSNFNNNESIDEEEESLVSNSIKESPDGNNNPTAKDLKKPSNHSSSTDNLAATINNHNNTNANNNNNINTNNKQSNEEKEFLNKINKHRTMFQNGKFDDLENLIQQNTSDSNTYEFKFNFTFEKYQYGDKKIAYIIRCIDNKNDVGLMNSDDESEQCENNPKIIACKKEKIEHLKELIEIGNEDKEALVENVNNFMQYSLEDPDFQTCLIKGKEDIKKMSRVHGKQKEEQVMDDENSSQSSQAGYNNELSKIDRIEEIRVNLMRNVSSFYTLKWFRVTSLAFFSVTLIFAGLYYYLFIYLYQDSRGLLTLHSSLYLLGLQFAQLTSSLISLRGVYKMESWNLPIPLNSFTSDKMEYFNILKNQSEGWYNTALDIIGKIKKDTVKYLPNIDELIWYQHSMNYSIKLPFDDTESFTIGLGQTLSNMHNLLHNRFFTANKSLIFSMDTDSKDDLEYSAYMSIENSYDNALPNIFSRLAPILQVLFIYSESLVNYIYIIVFTYGAIIVLLSICFLLLLLETNKNMGEGFEKVSKITPEQIDDIIKRLEIFMNMWKKKDKRLLALEEADTLHDMKNTTNIGNSQINAPSRQNMDYSEGKVKKKLTIINSSFRQIPFVFIFEIALLLPLFLVTKEILEANYDMLSIQGFFYGRFLLTSSSTVMVKCLFSICSVSTKLDFYSFLNATLVKVMYLGLKKYPKFNDFYTENILLNACGSAYDANTTEYLECMESPLIQSLNNTDSLLKLISDDFNNLINELMSGAGSVPPGTYMPLVLYNSSSFNDLETAFYKYIVPVIPRFDFVLSAAFDDKINDNRTIVIIILVLLALIIVSHTIFLNCYFLRHLIHLLSVSRCIVKIIPTTVITTTTDLETWIEKINVKIN